MIRSLIAYLITLPFFFHLSAVELRKAGFFTDASVLYWQAEEGGLTYAVKSPSSVRLAPDAKAENPHFGWDFGFKAGIGYRFAHDRWEMELHYTSLQTHTDAEKKAKDGDVFFPIWQKPVSQVSNFADEVKMHWRLHLGLLDLNLSKPFYATPTLLLTPQLGIRAGWIRQKFNIEYRGGNFAPGEDELIRMKNKYWGLGPKMGLLGDWVMGRGFALFAQGAFSLLYGEFYLHQDEDTLGTKEKLLGIHSIFRAFAPIIEGTAGIRWQRVFSGSLNRVSIELAWDQLLFFSQNQLLRFVSTRAQGQIVSNQGDLSLAGVQLGARFDF